MSDRRTLVATFLLGPMLLVGPPAQAQTPYILMPGQVYDNVPAVGYVEKRTKTTTALFDQTVIWEQAFVGFRRMDSQTQMVKVYASSDRGIPVGAEAIGQLRLEFCVPRTGLSACDAVSDPAASDIAVKITFGYGVVGRVMAIGPGSKAELQAAARVVDLERGKEISYQNLEYLTASLGTVKVVSKIPVPLPDYSSATVTSPAAFTTVLKRGRRYQFQVRARAYAFAGEIPGVLGSLGRASADLSTNFIAGLFPEAFVSLRDLSFEVSPDPDLSLSDLHEVVKSLQEQLGSLAGELDALRASLLGEQPETATCDSNPPGTGWVCVNGGWVPPDHPLVPTDSGPSTPSECPGSAPAPGWVCVRGGWLPPDHPGARGGG